MCAREKKEDERKREREINHCLATRVWVYPKIQCVLPCDQDNYGPNQDYNIIILLSEYKKPSTNVRGENGMHTIIILYILYALYPRKRGPMGSAPYNGPRVGDGPIFEVSVSHLPYFF